MQAPPVILKPENGIFFDDLDDGLTQEHLFTILRDYGQLEYIKVHRFPFVGKPKNYAFAYFANQEQADRAREDLKYKRILKRQIRALRIQDYDQKANLFLKGFKSNEEIDLCQLEKFLCKTAQEGTIQSLKQPRREVNDQELYLPYGYVQFDNPDAAKACVQGLENAENKFGDQELKAVEFQHGKRKGFESTMIYIKDFDQKVEFDINNTVIVLEYVENLKQQVREKLEKFGQISDIFVKIEERNQQPFAIVQFVYHENAREALDSIRNTGDLLGKNIKTFATWHKSKEQRAKEYEGSINDRYVFIKNFRQGVGAQDILPLLEQFGEVEKIRFDRIDHFTIYGPPAKVAYVIFKNSANAKRFVFQSKKYIRSVLEGQNVEEGFEPFKKLEQFFQNGMIVEHLYRPSWLPNDKRKNAKRQNQRPRQDVQPHVSPMMHGQNLYPPMMMPFGAMPHMMMPMSLHQRRFQPTFKGPSFYQGFRHTQQNKGIIQPTFNIEPPYQIIPTTQQQVSYDQRPDFLAYLRDKSNLTPTEQRKRLGLVLTVRLQEKKPDIEEQIRRRIIGMFVGEDFTIEEIEELLTKESELDERVEEAIELLESGDADDQ